MTEDELRIANTVFLILFVGGLLVSGASLAVRTVSFILAHRRVPTLLKRDDLLFTGLVVPFAGIVIARAFQLQGLGTNPLWVIGTGSLAVLGVWSFAWWELTVVGRRKPGEGPR